MSRPSVDEVRAWLGALPDPEIPVITLADLGVIRDVAWEGERLAVTVTPTYSGCPATGFIARDIARVLRDHGIEKHDIRQRLAPPWTTDWMAEAAKDRLEAYGIAPPAPKGPERCPHCGAEELERVSPFGSTPCKALWRCRSCGEPFDHFKCH